MAGHEAIEVKGGDYEHVLDFAASIPNGWNFAYTKTAATAFAGVVQGGGPFDVTEYSLANHIMLQARGERKLPALPVFPSRSFRNCAIYVAADSPLLSPADLAGKKVGLSEFAMTAAVWARGHMQDDFGLDPRSIAWTTGPNPRFAMPEGFEATSTGENLEDLVASGQLDAIITGKPKDAQRPAAERHLRCLIADPAGFERAYFDRTGIYPIMHTLVLHEDCAGDTDMARALFDTYVAARRKAIARKLSATFVPFVERDWEVLTGPHGDPTRYGLTPANIRAIEALSRYLREQGLIDREPSIESLFLAGSADWADEPASRNPA